jgi:hypothetical protein
MRRFLLQTGLVLNRLMTYLYIVPGQKYYCPSLWLQATLLFPLLYLNLRQPPPWCPEVYHGSSC